MKCPKCNYLGFETGDRCKNCGYDFSLMADLDPEPTASPEPLEIDLNLRESGVDVASSRDWLAQIDQTVAGPESTSHGGGSAQPVPGLADLPRRSKDERAPALPLLALAADEAGDEPLITLPPAPRPPLAVRRTPDTSRLRTPPQAAREIEPAPALAFDEDISAPPEPRAVPKARSRASRVWADAHTTTVSGARARLMAAVIDHLMLSSIDVAVIYFTLRMAGLSMSEWRVLPATPLVAFLLLVKVSYFSAFTAVGGQTIGKMAARIRVVSADDRPLDAALALRRTLAGVFSAALLGLGFLPALFGSERRALHDRIARTRVVALPSTVGVRPHFHLTRCITGSDRGPGSVMNRLALLIATCGYIGYVPLAPGTFGSAAGLVVYLAVRSIGSRSVEIGAIVALTCAGVWSATVAERQFGRIDPGPVVIDEVVGMLITLAFLPVSTSGVILGFLVFRLLDIVKPWPSRRLEALPGGFGVVADDSMAALYGNLALRGIIAAAPEWWT